MSRIRVQHDLAARPSALGHRQRLLDRIEPQHRRDARNSLSVAEIASRAATSVRTLSRVFLAETGLTFKVWRQRARIVPAMDSLARGKAIAQVAAELGFANTAAFACALRQVTATTPTAFLGPPP